MQQINEILLEVKKIWQGLGCRRNLVKIKAETDFD